MSGHVEAASAHQATGGKLSLAGHELEGISIAGQVLPVF